jgi:hypothetical protein
LLALSLAAAPSLADDSMSPHRMLDANGKADTTKCAVCHTETLELARPKSETCVLCHSETQHAGSYEHLHATPDAVRRALTRQSGSTVKLPLAENGTIYCGTCHLFHDPALSEEKPLPMGRAGDQSKFAAAVRESLRDRVAAITESRNVTPPVADFPAKGTTALRMAASDGSLCRSCHESYGQ